MIIYNLGSINNSNEDWKEKFKQDDHPPKDNTCSSPIKSSSSNTDPSPSTNSTPRFPKILLSKNRSELFKVLDLKISASSIECKKAYKKLARQYHPDKWKSIKPFSKLKGNAQLQNISNAHEEICMLKNLF